MMTSLHLLELVNKSIVIHLIHYPQIRSPPKVGPRRLLLASGKVYLPAIDYLLDLLLVDAGEIAEGGVHSIYGCFLVEAEGKRAVVGERRHLDYFAVEEGQCEEK